MAISQIPSDVLVDPANGSSSRACPDRNAGTVGLGTFTGQSNDISLNRSFFCINDQLDFIHNGDAEVLDSDPDATTPPGIGYAWYTCPPTIDRPNLDAVFTDPCLLTNPTPANGIYVYVDDITGDATFQNGNQIGGQSIPDFFNGGEPVEMWFAPVTIDAVSAGQAIFEGSPSGSCVHVNTSAAFSIVYLTPVSGINRRVISDGSGGCLGSFEVRGGLPQFTNTESYTITIEHEDMPGTFATLQGSNYGHGDEVTFSFTQEGTYQVVIEDGKSCAQSFSIDLLCTNPVSFTIGSAMANMGDVVCIPITIDGFIDMGTTSFDIVWDPNIFEYVSNTGFLIDSDPLAQLVDTRVNEGRLRVLWLARNLLTGQTEPDGTVFFELCLRAIGECGEETPIFFDGNVIVADFNNNDLAYLVNDGSAQVNIGSLSALADVCPDDGTGTGSIKITMCGGMPNYSINYSGPSGGTGTISEQNGMQLIENLMAGNYTFNITDALGDMLVVPVTIPAGSIHSVSLSVDDPTCWYSSDGKVGLNISPSGTYGIAWSTNEFNVDTIRNVGNGQYQITVTDDNGCAVTESVTVNTAPIVLTSQVTDATCQSSANGSVNVSGTGGTPLYVFQWDGFPPSAPSTTNNRTNLMRGSYGLTVTDAVGCFVVDSFTIEANQQISVDQVIATDAICNGDSTGHLRVEVSTVGAPLGTYLFEWERNLVDVSSWFANGSNFSEDRPDRSGLPAGQYDVRITDFDQGADCFLDTFFTISEPPPIEVSLNLRIDETCNPGSDGEIRISASGGRGTGPASYIYDWDDRPSINDFTPTQQGLSAGDFPVRIYDSSDLMCWLDTVFYLQQEEGPEILSFDSVSISCGSGMDGELEVFYVRPIGQSFDVNWTDQNDDTYTGDRITGLDPGTYTVTVTASAGCSSVDTVTLGAATDITLDSVHYNIPTCPGGGNGSVTIFASGPGGGLHYEWNHMNGSDNALLPSVGEGTYTVTITADGSNCDPLIIDTLTIRPPMIFDVMFSGITGATCPGICNGEATVMATGGMGAIGYRWSNGDLTPTTTGLCPGMNFVIINDMLCSDTFYIDIPAADSISLSVAFDHPTCFGDSDGFITLTPSGSNPPFNVSWNDGPVGPDRTLIGEGLYIATTSDAMGCERIDSFNLMAPDELMATVEPSDLLQITCAGRNDGRATIAVVGGNGGYTYDWTPDVSSTNAGQNLMPGNYTVVVTDVEGCTDVVMFDISEPDAIQFIFGDQSQIQCFGETAEFTVDTAFSGAGGPYTFTVNNGVQQELGQTVQLLGGDYVITVIDSSGCFIDSTITISQPPEITLDIGPDITVTLGDSVMLEIISIGGAFPIDSFIWTSTGNDLSCINCPTPWITPATDATVNLTVVDSTGCRAQDELLVFVDASRKVYIPNAFSPNNDGINDVFEVFTGLGVREIELMYIFNRWGDKVFEGRNLTPDSRGSGGWDGTFKGELLNPGVFAFVVQVSFVDNKVITYNGEVQLVK